MPNLFAAGDVVRDIRLAWRSLCRTPGFLAATTASLALGFALTAVIEARLGAGRMAYGGGRRA